MGAAKVIRIIRNITCCYYDLLYYNNIYIYIYIYIYIERERERERETCVLLQRRYGQSVNVGAATDIQIITSYNKNARVIHS